MVLKKEYETVAWWGEDKWIVESKPRYCWTTLKGHAITEWYTDFNDALQFAIKSGTQ